MFFYLKKKKRDSTRIKRKLIEKKCWQRNMIVKTIEGGREREIEKEYVLRVYKTSIVHTVNKQKKKA